jgi:hypothetical protein
MKNKKIIFALITIALAAVIFIVSEKMAAVRPAEYRAKFFPVLEERQITAIVVSDGNSGNVLKLSKQDDGAWTVGAEGAPTDSGVPVPFPADGALVQIALEKITSLKKGEPVSGNPEKQAAFEVGDSARSFVKIYAGKDAPAGVLLVGKNGPDWNSNYARLTGSDTVYLVPGGLRQSLFFDIERWKKKEPVAEDADADSSS